MKYKITEEGRHNIKELSDRHMTKSLLPGEELETMSYVDNNGAIWDLSILLSSKKICDMVSFGDDQGNTFHYGFDRLPYYAADFLLRVRNQYTGNNETYVSFTACWPSYYIYEQIFTYTGELENGNIPVQYRNNAPVPISRLANDPDFTNKFKECSYIGEDPISGTTRFPNWTILENAMSNDGGNKCWIDGVDAMTSVKDNNGSTFTFNEYNESNKTLKCDISLSYYKLSSPIEVITKGINYEGLGRIEGFEAITENFPEFGDIHLFNVGLWDSEAFGNENPFTGSWGPFTAFYLCAGDAHLIWKVDTSAGAFNPEAITRQVDVAQADLDTYANSIEGYLFGDPKYARNTSLNPSGDTYTCVYPYTGNNDDVVSPGVIHRLFEGLTPSTFSEWSINDGELPDGITNVWKWNSTYNRMSASGYVNGTNYTTNATLTSPVIDLTNATDCMLTMTNIVNFGNPDNCKIYVQEIGGSLIALDVQPMPGGSNWESVEGSASLKAFDGKKIQIILSYESTTSEATTWDVYNVYIDGAIKEESEDIFSIIPDLNSFVPRDYDYGLLMYCHNFPESPYQGSKISWGLSDGFQAELTNTYKKTALISGTGKIIYHYDPNDMSKTRTFSSVGSYVAPPTLYITGAGAFKNGEWNPETPDEFQFINGEYVYEVEELTQFKISTDCGDWDSFNVNSYGCDYGDEPGLTVYLETPWDNNIICPWKGNYKIVVSGDLSTITLTTDTPNPEGPTPIYIRGDMNNWDAVEEWELESISSNIWRFVCNEEQSIPKDWAFKIADADWYKINIGGDGGAIPFENTSEVFNGGYPANLTFSDVFNGVLWLRIDEECLLEASNNKNYIPDWVDCEVPPLPVEPVASTPVITQDGLFIKMTCEDVESDIRYSLDGSTPTESSTLFTTPIRVKAPLTIKAIAFKDGYQASEIAIKDVKERTVTLASPKIEVSENNEVTITHEDSSATICFTTDGTTPNEESEIYSWSFTQNEGETIKAIAFKGSSDKSSIVTYVPSSPVKPIASTPVITQDGLYFSITCEDAADLYVIQDGKVNTNTSETQGWWNYAWATTEVNGEKVWQFRTADGGAAGSMGFLTGNEQKWLSGKLNGAKLHIEWNYEGAAGATYNVRLTANGANNGGSVEQDQPLPAPAEGWNTTIFDIATDFPNVNNCWKNSEGTGTAFIFSIIANNCSADSRLNIRNVWYSDLNESYAPPVEVELPKPTSVPTYNYAADTQIRYTLDGSEPSQSSMLYTNPFRTALPCTIKAIAFKDGYQASEMAIKDVKERRVTLATPHIHVSLTNEVTISHEDSDVVICYTTDGSTPNEESEIYITPFRITSNQTVKAIAYKGSEEKSLVATTINLSKTPVPEIIFSNGSVTLTHSLNTATLYYAIGSAEDWKVYSGSSFDVSDNRTIYAYAKAPNQADSDVVEYKPDYFVAPVPDMKYDGRYLLLSSITDCSLRIKSQSSGNYFYPQSGEKIEIKEVGKFELRITAANYNVNTVEFEIRYYFDGERATLAEAGLLEASMEWMTEADKGAVRELTLTGAASVEDFPAICSLSSLETIDMTDLTVAPGTMTGVATDGLKKLRYAVLPKEATSIVGAQALVSACPNICAVKWTAPIAVPSNFSESFPNKNLLIYLDARAYAPASTPNVIVAGQATDGIILTDGYPFYCPEAFTANRAEITRDFSMTSGMGEAQGWETIALPFSADRFEHESAGSITPFAAATGEDTPFWLYGLSSGGWEAASEIEANTPYIISMPNNEAYADRFNLNGKVRIYAENVEVPVTQDGESTYGSRHFRTSMMPMEASTAFYNLNDAMLTGGYRPGSVFIPGLRDVRPLEAYMTTNSPERAIRIFNDFTHVDLLPAFGDDGLSVRSLNGAIIISSMTERDVRVMDAAGAVVASPRLMPGEETRIDSLPHGVYFVGGIKVII
ncbi:MAG: chitobiase/beta-hexosaminidase C-terminal domain-containing protein [Muribaculaceae bacterium]|nr:chitobiase/beta-hexosaminidase C-terminal domain-containing protein [Muribaculaceae bacterium]